jgi:hypothetical protein
MDTIALGQGGYFTLPGWRADILAIPVKARVSVPSLDIVDQRASILTDGLVRARLQRSQAGAPGIHEAIWTLTLPIIGEILTDEDEPQYESFEVTTQFEITDDPAKLDPMRDYFDARGLPTPTYLRQKMLFGLPLLDANNRLYGDAPMQAAIYSAAERIERALDTTIGRRVFSSIPGTTDFELEVVQENGYDMDPTRFRNAYGLMRLRHHPVSEVRAYELWLGDRRIREIPPSWIRISHGSGDVQLLPDATTTLMSQFGGSAIPLLGSLNTGSAVPHLIRTTYVAGWKVDASLADLIAWVATQVILITISDSVTAGLASISTSIDGVSESVSTTNSSTNSTYGAFIIEIGKRITEWMKTNADSYSGGPKIAGW